MVPPNAECEKDSLDVLHASTRSSPFLPNLEKIRYKSHWISGREFVKWVTMALSPSVRTFQSWQCRLISISGWIDAWMSLELAVVLLRNISSGCPNLELLEIFPSNITGGSDIAPLSTVIVDFSDCLSSFANLRTLSSNAIVLEPCIFLALSKLPHLESLTLYPNQSDGVANGLALSEDAFPTLRELELNMLNLECLTYLFGLKLLVRQLKSLRIALRPNLASHGGKSSLSLTKQICAFAEHNSVLSSLSIEGEYPSYMVEIDSALVKCFSHFPLQLLALPVHTFSLGVNLHDLFEALPTIEQLYITPNGFRVMKLEDLRMFASCKQLPYLRLLGVSVNFESVFDVPEMGSGACQVQSLLPMQFQSCFEQVGEYEGLGKPVARYALTNYILSPYCNFHWVYADIFVCCGRMLHVHSILK